MKWTTAFALTVFLGLLALVVGSIVRHEPEDPLRALDSLTEDYRNGLVDLPEALDRLGSFLDDADRMDRDTKIRFLLARSVIYRELGALTQARDDLETIRILMEGKGGSDLELAIADLTAAEGRISDAAAYAFNVVQSDPTSPAAWALLGRLESQLSEAAQEAAMSEATQLVDRSSAAEIRELIEEFCARDSDDPRKEATLGRLNAFVRDRTQTVLPEAFNTNLEEASQRAQAARDALARAIELRPDARSIERLADTLVEIGRPQDAIALLLSALASERMSPDPLLLLAAAELLSAAGDTIRLRPYLRDWEWRDLNVDLETLGKLCKAFYDDQEPALLGSVCAPLRIVGGKLGAYWYDLYRSAASIFAIDRNNPSGVVADQDQRGVLSHAAERLRSFAKRDDSPMPFADAEVDAYLLAARAERLLNNVGNERSTLDAAVQSPSAATAENLLRLAEIQGQTGVQRAERVERLITRALNLDPSLSRDLMARWVQASDDALLEAGLDFEELYSDAVQYGNGRPMRDVGPATTWRMARRHLDSRRPYQASRLADDLIADYPSLLPALDLKIEAELGFGGRYEIATRVLRRIELGGVDESIEPFIRAAGSELRGELLERAILAAPERFGRPAAARLALAEGATERAVEMLRDMPAADTSPSVRWLRARAYLGAGQYADALPDLEALLEDSTLGVEATEQFLFALDKAQKPARLATAVEQVISDLGGGERLESALGTLNRLGRKEEARRLITALDVSEETRSPEFFRGLVLHAAQTRDPSILSEAVERAAAYVEDGTVELAGLTLDVSERNWLSVPQRVQQLRERAAPERGSIVDAILCLLEERVEDGLRIADRGLAAQPRSPQWALVRASGAALERRPLDFPAWFGPRAAEEAAATLLGTRSARRDPRELLTALLLVPRAEWGAWVHEELDRITSQGGGTLWPGWMRYLAASEAERDAVLEGLRTQFPKFGPTWDVELARARAQHAGDPLARPLLAAHVRRLANLGDRTIEDPLEIAVARSAQDVLRGNVDEALSSLGTALTREERDDFEAMFMLGHLLLERGQPGFAVLHFERAATIAPPAARGALADALVEAIEAATTPKTAIRNPLGPDQALAHLEDATRLFPTDPGVALAALKAALRHAVGKPAVPESLAQLQVSRLRRAAPNRTFEELRPGSTSAWVQWCVEFAPNLGTAIVEEDLARRPGDVALWSLRAELLASAGAHAEASRHHRVVLTIEPDARSLLAQAERLMAEGALRRDVLDLLREVRRLGDADDRARADMLDSSEQLGYEEPPFDVLIERLERTWQGRESLSPDLQRSLALQILASHVQAAASLLPTLRGEAAENAPDPAERLRAHREWQLSHTRRALEFVEEIEDFDLSTYELRLLQAYRGLLGEALKQADARES